MDIFHKVLLHGDNTPFPDENVSQYFQEFPSNPPGCCDITDCGTTDHTNHVDDAIKKELAFAEKLLYESYVKPNPTWVHSGELLVSDDPNYAPNYFVPEENLPLCLRNIPFLELSPTGVETLPNDLNGMNEFGEMSNVLPSTHIPETQSMVKDQDMLILNPESQSEPIFLQEVLWNDMGEMFKSSPEICIEGSGLQSCQIKGDNSNLSGTRTSKTTSKSGNSRDYNRGKPLSMDLREMILQLYLNGLRISKIARRVGVSHSCVSKIVQRFCSTGSLYPSNSKECPVKRFR
ncbi:Paired box domain-containing protein [Ditylenchus destructor]|uniref:Paired box domain-containing protein n=1 Tax=Ditylenchus destructor TaxID=166010 RepID=A0AAD4MSC7_9BILA|nr:Paired box domain-containing protein [Ditylenchus destructor]